jgi:hypothetical protein
MLSVGPEASRNTAFPSFTHSRLPPLSAPCLAAAWRWRSQAQRRGTRGKAGAKLSSAEDEVAHFLTCRDHNTLLFVSDRGVAYGLRAFQVGPS